MDACIHSIAALPRCRRTSPPVQVGCLSAYISSRCHDEGGSPPLPIAPPAQFAWQTSVCPQIFASARRISMLSYTYSWRPPPLCPSSSERRPGCWKPRLWWPGTETGSHRRCRGSVRCCAALRRNSHTRDNLQAQGRLWWPLAGQTLRPLIS